MARLLLSLPVATQPGGGDPRRIVDLARRAEDAGMDGVVLAEHLAMGPRTDRYPWGQFRYPVDAPWLDPLTMLTAVAMATERVTLATGVLVAPLRPAILLAKAAATLDVLSGGRLELGVGTGWQEEEFTAAGVDFSARGRILTDTMAACRSLWRDSPATFRSPTVTFDRLWSEPKPLRPGGPRVLFAGSPTQRTVRRIVELGDGWLPILGSTPDDVAAGVAAIRVAWAHAGRDPADLRVRVLVRPVPADDVGSLVRATIEHAGLFVAAGVTDVVIGLAPITDDTDLPAWFDAVAQHTAGRPRAREALA